MLLPNLTLSIAQIKSLSKLKQKKFRSLEQKVIVEGFRTLSQLADWGLIAEELYLVEGQQSIPAKVVYQVTHDTMNRICDSDSPPSIAGLFELPKERVTKLKTAFYLDGISDPGNMGTIFRIAAAFGIDALLISPQSCEISSPKVIRASLGAVYKVPFYICDYTSLKALGLKILVLDMHGSVALQDFAPQGEAYILALGSEAHGLSGEIKEMAETSLRIDMHGDMESLNVAVCAGICAFQLSKK
ncbi:MAG: RNA methyltransferase [Candidatus Cloacimonetes bacterium]|nr:RNA methyltransferase [Candidatus Cloacimonadota bacterium]MDD3235536.1 RNA methyltransferase [Candidatus Cloacimonadota bacterium]